ncbi:MAG: TIGR01777 family oxidoreductase [Chitinophagaceae bacterium]|nr:TIGR01777 family oxidoreductase [Chitinophagaceae bacterium]
MNTVMIAGGTGLIGTALSEMLVAKGYEVIILTRSPGSPRKNKRNKKRKEENKNISYAVWDINRSIIDPLAIAKADHIIHVAGAGVADKRWTDKRKAEIINSRINSSKLLIKALAENENKVKSVVSASAIGWYGPDTKGSKRAFTENDPPHTDFLGETCRLWEQSIEPVTQLGKRLVILRTGIVFSNDGGAFPEFKKPFKAGIAAILGGGKQMVSWIHIDDLCRMYIEGIENNSLSGIYNAVAAEPVTNKELILRIAKVRKKPFIPIHVPEFVLKLALGEMSIEVLKSATVDNRKIQSAGFKFLYPTLDAALNELISQNIY